MFRPRMFGVAVAVMALLVFSGPVQRSPDGIEMIAMVRGWFSDVPSGVSAWYWPPLWPILAVVFGAGRWAEHAGWGLNIGCAAGTAYFLSGLAFRAAGGNRTKSASAAALLVAVAYGLLPAVGEQVATLDARALGGFLLVAAAESTLAAIASPTDGARKAWLIAGSFAFLAPLARPEGALTAGVVALVAGFYAVRGAAQRVSGGVDPRFGAVGLALAGVALGFFCTRGRAWEMLALPWIGVWPTGDILALYGFASAPTPYREWVLASGMALGGPTLPSWSDFVGAGLEVLNQHAVAMGWALMGAGAVGVAIVSRRQPFALVALAAPVVLLALSPQRSGQLSAAANVVGFVPVWLAMVAALLVLLPSLLRPVVLIGCVASALVDHSRRPTTQFVEGTALTAVAAEWLDANVPPQSVLYCSFSSRALVRDAGLVPVATPSPFESWEPAVGEWLVLSSVDARGNDAGRTLDVGADPAWKLVELFSAEQQGGGSGHWYAILRRESL